MAENILLELLELAFSNKLTASFAREAVKVNHNIRVVRFPMGSQFISYGKKVEKIYLVIEGKCNIVKCLTDETSLVVDVVEPVQLLGLFEILGEQTSYRESVTAGEDMIAVEIDAAALLEEVENDPHMARVLLKYTSRLMADSVAGKPRNTLNPLSQRMVVALHRRCNGRAFPVMLQDGEGDNIARELRATTNAIQRILARLRMEGLISVSKGKVTISTEQFVRLNQIYMLMEDEGNAES